MYDKFVSRVASGDNVERTSFFSDAVFAIAMTLLAVEIKVPDVPAGELTEALVRQVPEFLAYGLSFLVTGAYWITHHRLFKLLTGYTPALQRLNLMALLFVGLTGYGTGLLARYGDQPEAVTAYALIVAMIGLAHTGLWVYAKAKGLLGADADPGLFRYLRARSLTVPCVFLLSIPVAAFTPSGAEYCWLAVFVIDVVLVLVYRARPAPPAMGGERQRPPGP